MEKPASSLDGILEDLLMVPPELLEEAIQAHIERFPHHRERLTKFAEDTLAANRYSRKEAGERSLPTPGRIGRFQPVMEIGRGSQGIIYKAEQIGIARSVALKVIREGVLASAKERLRFENEVQLISRLRHPNIVTVYDCGIEGGRAYFAMEYIEGKRLDEIIKESAWSIADSLQVFLQITDAVSYAHQHGIIHRDLKPSNILVDWHRNAHVLDFGLAKAIDERNAPTVTEFGIFAGTWPYASPEQVDTGESVTDVRSDIYTLGVILFQMLTGRFPYSIEADTKVTRENILKMPPRRPSSFRSEISDDLDTIVLRALAKDADRRYQSAAAFGDDLRRYLRNEAIEAKRDSRWYVLKKTIENYRWQFRVAAAGVLGLIAFSGAVTWLYFEAIRARATTEARTNLVRVGQRYLHDRLRDYYMLANAAEAYKASAPEAIAVARLKKPPLDFPPAEFAALGEMPQFASEAAETEQAEVVKWLGDHHSILNSLVELTKAHRFRFRSEEATSSWLIEHRPMGVPEAISLCRAFVAQADYGPAREAADVLSFLSAARSVGLDLADEPSYLYKATALECRLCVYQAMGKIIARAGGNSEQMVPYKEWLREDPPLPRMEDAHLHERTRILQYLEASVEAEAGQRRARLNLDVLNELTFGYYGEVGFLTPQMRAIAEYASPERMVEALNNFTVPAALSSDDREALRLLWPLLSDQSGIAELMARAEATKLSAEEMLQKCAP